MTGRHRFRVIKLGGSLLDLDGLLVELQAWMAAQIPATNVMVVGGGRLADVIRDAYGRHNLTEEAAHWLCVRVLNVTAELVHRLLPESQLSDRIADLRSSTHEDRTVLFQTERFMREDEPERSSIPLPRTWDVTSDSIAARLAALLDADELVLVKSCLPTGGFTAADAAQTGYTDRYFPKAVAGVRAVRCVNLRADGHPAVTLSIRPGPG